MEKTIQVGMVCFTIIICAFIFIGEPKKPEIDNMACMPITISGAGTNDLRADVDLSFDVAVCRNSYNQAVIYGDYDIFVNDMIGENEEWK